MTKPREKTREELQAEIEDGKKKIRQFENREKMLRQKLSKEERRTRSHRLIVRGAVFESIVPEAKTMTDEETAAFLRLALTSEPTREYLKNEPRTGTQDKSPTIEILLPAYAQYTSYDFQADIVIFLPTESIRLFCKSQFQTVTTEYLLPMEVHRNYRQPTKEILCCLFHFPQSKTYSQ